MKSKMCLIYCTSLRYISAHQTQKRDILLSPQFVYLIGREKVRTALSQTDLVCA